MDWHSSRPGEWPSWGGKGAAVPNSWYWYGDQSWWGMPPYGKGGPSSGDWAVAGAWPCDYTPGLTPWPSGKGKGKGGGLFWEDTLGTLPKDSQFYCEPCEMDLCTADALEKHKLTYHVKCPSPGCDYSAPPHLVEEHKWNHMADCKA
ncbi:hypothetical protein FOZ61_001495, partial [Perkinsus olseni]